GGPWGQAFPEPLFDGEFELVEKRIVADRHLKLKLRTSGNNSVLDAIAFNTTDEDWPYEPGRIQVAYRLAINEYRGSRQLQLVLEYIEPA
ncbi:MAG: single-stranded-DNA-specific exonuclease RecJ, partial [Gammaproteobacteria bacterium]